MDWMGTGSHHIFGSYIKQETYQGRNRRGDRGRT